MGDGRGPGAAGTDAEERRRRGITFRELAGDYLEWLEHVKGRCGRHSETIGW